MKSKIIFRIILTFLILSPFTAMSQNESTKKERNNITSGNKLYEEGKLGDALKKYDAALKENPSSAVARYNKGLTEILIGVNPGDTTQAAQKMKEEGVKLLQSVASMGATKPQLASKANYNLGNVAFGDEDYQSALNYYKQALRLNPEDDNARKNLRITQLKLQNQDENQDNQDNQDQNQNQEENGDQNQDQEDQQENQDDQNQDQQPPQQPQQQEPQSISPQTAEQILNAMENKENQTRARMANEQGEEASYRYRNRKNW